MPAKSAAQQRLMGAALSAKKGAEPISKKVSDVSKSMSKKELQRYAGTKHKGLPKKVKKESSMLEVYGVRKPFDECGQPMDLVVKIDPMRGVSGMGMSPEMFEATYIDEKEACGVAESLYKEYSAGVQALEEKKTMTGDKIKKTIDALEKKRKAHMDMVKENPKEASTHREKIADLTSKIDDLMNKMEKIEKSKKQIEKEDKKEK